MVFKNTPFVKIERDDFLSTMPAKIGREGEGGGEEEICFNQKAFLSG